jgi:hypothetical protein
VVGARTIGNVAPVRPAVDQHRPRRAAARAVLVAAVACVVLAAVPATVAASPPSAVQQYIETLPTGAGGQPIGPGTTPPSTPPSGSAQSGSSLRVSPQSASRNGVVAAAFDSGSTTDTVLVALGLAIVVASGAATAGWRLHRRVRAS